MSAIWFHKTDIARLVRDDVVIDTELSISKLPRVASATLTPTGPINVKVGFQSAQKGIVLLDGEVSGSVRLRCQRCLEAMAFEVSSSLRLALLVNERQLEWVPDDYEPLTSADGEVRVADLIEDEILLLLPIAAKHADDECGPLNESVKALRGSARQKTTAPFAGLATMMRDGTD